MSTEYVSKVNNKPIAASEAAPSSSLATTIAGKQDSLGLNPTSGDDTKFLNEKGQFAVPAQGALNTKLDVDGTNATQPGVSKIIKTCGDGSDNLYNGDRFPANGHSNGVVNPNDFTLRSTDHLINFLLRNGLGGWNYFANPTTGTLNHDASMKVFGHAYGATIDSDSGCYGWKIGETSHTSGYSSAAFKAIVVVWEWDAPNWDHNGYSGRNFVGVLDITHRITEGTISDSADKKIGTLTCICPMYCENSNGNRGYTVFVKQAANTHKAEWYIGRNTASANMNSKIQYGRLSIFPIMEYRWKKFMVQQNASISFNSDKDEYWGNRNVPYFSYSNYTGIGSTTRPVYIKANGEITLGSEMLKKDASNVVTSTDGTGAAANICGSLAEGTSDITSPDVYFITTDSAGTSDGKWYKRKLDRIVAYLKSDASLRKSIVRYSIGSNSQPIFVDSSGWTQPCNMSVLIPAINGSDVGRQGADPTATDGQAHPVYINGSGKPAACCYTSRGGAILNYRMTCPVKWTPVAGNLNGVTINKNSYTRLTNGIFNLDSAYFPQNITLMHAGLPVLVDVALWVQNATSGTDVTEITIGISHDNVTYMICERTFQIVPGYDGYLYATFLAATIGAINSGTPFDIWIKSNGSASNTARAYVFAYSMQGMIVL